MLNKTFDLKMQWVRKLFLAITIASCAMITTLASPGVGSAEAIQSQSAISDELLQKHSEIDAYVFEKHADEIANQGIQVTSTGPIGDAVEIAILDYTDEKADYLYGIFGTDLVKVVEGQQAVLMESTSNAATVAPVSSNSTVEPQTDINADLLQKQREIDAYVFEQHADELAAKGIQVTNTGIVGDTVEIAILDYTDEKADYLYGIFGTEQVKVVKGQQAELLGNDSLTTTAAVSEDTGKASNSGQNTAWIVAIVIAVLGGIALFSRKLRVSKK